MSKQFIVGPVELYQSTRNVYKKNFTYFRTQEYSNIVNESLSILNKMLGNSIKNSLIYLTASGTAAMEAVVENCCSKSDKVLVVNGGTFGQRFCDLLEHHNIPFNEVKLDWNEKLTKKHLLKFENKKYTMFFVNLHETSTGQLYDIKIISEFCKRNNTLLVVDAISTFCADKYNMQKYGIDVTIISSHKGLCLSPGISLISFSKRILNKINKKNNKIVSKYFDFRDYLTNIVRGQTPYTPAVFIMYELQDMLKNIKNKGGINAVIKEVKEKSLYFRKKAKEIGLQIPKYPLSNMLTPIVFKNIKASEVVKILKEQYKLFINPCSGSLADKVCRVSHIGNTTKEDIDNLIEKIKIIINKLKNREGIC